MLPTHHCELCEHQKVNLKEGSICKLTNEKPAFKTTCPKIHLSETFEEKVKEVNIHYQHILKDRWWTYAYTIVFMLLSGLVFLGLYKFNARIAEMFDAASNERTPGYLVVVYIVIAAAGVVLLGMGVGAFNAYRRKLHTTLRKKKKIDDVLALYHINYNVEVTFGRKYHSTQEVTATLERKIF